MGVFQCGKMQFHAKIGKFYVRLVVKFMNFSKCAKISYLYVKFYMQKWKNGVIGCELMKKRGHRV